MARTNVTELTDAVVKEITAAVLRDTERDFVSGAPRARGWTWTYVASSERVSIYFYPVDDQGEEVDEDGKPLGEEVEFEVTITAKRLN
jgi:hypothetical protein